MSKIQKKSLGKVSIGPFKPEPTVNVRIEFNNTRIEKGTLHDLRMGRIFSTTDQICSDDHIGCFGVTGYIPLHTPILNPAFESIMIQYLRLFRYQSNGSSAFLEIKEGIRELINANKSLVGYRKMKAISLAISTSGGNWSVWPEGGGVKFKKGNNVSTISGAELKQLLRDATTRYTSPTSNIHLDELGMNVGVSKPEDFVIEYIPVLPNTLRIPQQNLRSHAYTELYADIMRAITGEFKGKKAQEEKQGRTKEENIRDAYLELISKSDTMNLRDEVFTSSKDGFLRGHMYSKVGGQIARSVVVPDLLSLKPNQVGIPRKHALDLSHRMEVTQQNMDEIRRLIEENHITHVFDLRSKQYIRIDKIGESGKKLELVPGKLLVLRQLLDGDIVLANRQPTLHRNSLLAFEVVLHDDDVIKIHPSATSGFGMDFDGDEANIIVPYTQLGLREAKELMFVTWHMASLAASNLLVGYHLDTNLAAHVMTLPGTFVDQQIWDFMAQVVYQERWNEKYTTYDEWKSSFLARAKQLGVEPISGKSLWSTLLPEDMNWKTKKAEIKNGILVRGILDKGVLSGSPASIGMVMYRTYGALECVSWLNASYRSLNEYIIRMGVTLGISHLRISGSDKDIIDQEIKRSMSDPKLLEDTSLIKDPVLRERREVEITQLLNNVRERVAKVIMEGLLNTKSIPVAKDDIITIYQRLNNYAFDHRTVEDLREIAGIPIQGRRRIRINQDGYITMDLYNGIFKINEEEYPMSIFPVANINNQEYVYENPNPLLMMIKSGARGNETNGILISGIIGQLNYANGRIPRMMSLNRSMPCFAPNDNSPMSRGFIVPSYLRGMSPADYVSAHVASRENLTSNTDLTPKTGYFARRLRVFLEDLRIVKSTGKLIVTNEKGVIVMFDFTLNPSYLFEINGRRTFTDIRYEIDQLLEETKDEAIYLYVPLVNNMRKYLAIDRRIELIVNLYSADSSKQGKDIILALDPAIEDRYPDFYQYLLDQYKNLIILTIPDTIPENQKRYWYLSFDNYSRVIAIPLDKSHTIAVPILPAGNYIQINKSDINGISYPVLQGRISNSILYLMLISGTNFEKYTMSLEPSLKLFDLLKTRTLLESLIIMGPIYAM